MSPRLALSALLLSTAVPAQQFVVDPGGSGQFTSIDAAVNAVPSGSTLFVRAGSYGGFDINGKALAVLCDPGVDIAGFVVVRNTTAGQAVTLRGLNWPTATFPVPGVLLTLQSCAGPLLLEDVAAPSGVLLGMRRTTLVADSCLQLLLRGCSLDGFNRLTNCHTVVESSSFTGYDAMLAAPNTSTVISAVSALNVFQGSVQVAGSSRLTGGAGFGFGLVNSSNASGLSVSSATAFLRDGTINAGYGGLFSGVEFAVSGFAGTVVRDQRVALSSPSVTGSLTDTVTPLPSVTAASAAPGGAATMQATVNALDLTILLVGLPGPTSTVPGVAGDLWLDPLAFQWAGVVPWPTPVSSSLAIPPTARLSGTQLVWQAVVVDASGLVASNPALSVVR